GRPSTVGMIDSSKDRLSIQEMDKLRKIAVMQISHTVSLSSLSKATVHHSMKTFSNDLAEVYRLYEVSDQGVEVHPRVLASTSTGTEPCVDPIQELGSEALDLLPPWEAISREWIYDTSAPLGRVCTKVPWRDSSRPEYNFYYAAKRGLASIARLDKKQQSMFDDALSQLINKGFCAIVSDLRTAGLKKPTRSMCQAAWSTLVKGTAYEGSNAPLPDHYTPSHLVYRMSHPTTPCRIVFDFRELNRFSNRGGYPQNSLAGCLLAIRSYKYFVAGDLSKAFCRMSSNIDDVSFVGYTCIGPYVVLWSRVAFGSTAAPNQLDASMEDVTGEIKKLSVLASTSTFPVVYLRDLDRLHVDSCLLRPSNEAYNYLLGCPAVPKDITLVKFVDDLYTGGPTKVGVTSNYDFMAYISNGHDFLVEAKKRFNNWEPVIVNDVEERRHLLGYDYSAVNDSFYPTYSGTLPGDESMTKRQSCALLASLYDPLGLVVEHDMRARSIWRDVNKSTPAWDSIIPISLKKTVCDWVASSLQLAKSTPTPRYVPLDSPL
ncbi:hypothetical protein FOZ62_005932, partial [Perkinsus olseni]